MVDAVTREARARATARRLPLSLTAPQRPEDGPAENAQASEQPTPDGYLVVCRIAEADLKNHKLKEIARGHEHAIGKPLPLVTVPPLADVRKQLVFEFPYAESVIDKVLTDLVGRQHVHFRPFIVHGAPGSDKSLFSRRLAEVLGVHAWRTDASRSDGASFAGTDKRWYSAEPAHPFLAISRAKHANPIIIIDEIEKAGTRSDYGRFWDCLLGLIEPENSAR